MRFNIYGENNLAKFIGAISNKESMYSLIVEKNSLEAELFSVTLMNYEFFERDFSNDDYFVSDISIVSPKEVASFISAIGWGKVTMVFWDSESSYKENEDRYFSLRTYPKNTKAISAVNWDSGETFSLSEYMDNMKKEVR